MYGNLQRVHVVQVDIWELGEAQSIAGKLSVTVHRMAWSRGVGGEFHPFSDFANEYEADVRSEWFYRFIDLVTARPKPAPVYLNGARSTWDDVLEFLHRLGLRHQNAEGGGLSITNKVC